MYIINNDDLNFNYDYNNIPSYYSKMLPIWNTWKKNTHFNKIKHQMKTYFGTFANFIVLRLHNSHKMQKWCFYLLENQCNEFKKMIRYNNINKINNIYNINNDDLQMNIQDYDEISRTLANLKHCLEEEIPKLYFQERLLFRLYLHLKTFILYTCKKVLKI